MTTFRKSSFLLGLGPSTTAAAGERGAGREKDGKMFPLSFLHSQGLRATSHLRHCFDVLAHPAPPLDVCVILQSLC